VAATGCQKGLTPGLTSRTLHNNVATGVVHLFASERPVPYESVEMPVSFFSRRNFRCGSWFNRQSGTPPPVVRL